MKHLIVILASAISLAFSAYATETTSSPLRLAGGRELSQRELSGIGGTGSTCRYGCNEPNIACTVEYVIINGIPVVTRVFKQIWYPHWECAWSWGSDTCVPLNPPGDVACNEVRTYSINDLDCSGSYSSDWTTSSICSYAPPPGPG